MKKIFVTGATGFIGRELTKRLSEEGHQVTALYRSVVKANALSQDNIRLLKGNLLDETTLHTAMQDCDEVYHLAAFAAMWSSDPRIFDKLNFEATRRLLEIAREKGVKKVVVTSTAGVIGPSIEKEVTEDTERNVDFFSDYERTKWQSEEFIRQWDSGPMQVAIVNPTRVFGPGLLSISNGVTRMIDLYLRGRFRILPGKGHRIGNYAYIEDVVDGHLLAMEKGRHRERYLLGGNNVSYSNFFETLGQVGGRKYRQIRLPPQAILLLSKFMLWRANQFGVPPLITPQWVDRFNNYDWAVSSQKAKNELGYQITPFKQALESTV
ncbi:MAG TPA: NAD-dependent epimerase/dehydratase family protein, partial [Saprospiraceae bacterium]|nr:NAD-dependent epimerase/dehydratase family protein [Saprospiraceae bacterium]